MRVEHEGDHVLVVCPNPSVDIYAWIDEFVIGSANRIEKEERYPGGKGVHVAMALSELEIEVVLLGFWGSVTGQWIKDKCNQYYPNIKCIGPELDTWSRSCYTFKSAGAFDDSELLSTGPIVNNDDVDELIKYLQIYLRGAKALVLSGSWPQGARENGYAQMVKLAKEKNIPSFLDSTGRQLNKALAEKPYCVHLNRQEVLSYTKTASFEEAQHKIGQFCEISAITDGANGLFYKKADLALQGLFKIDKVYSTIGSGDCLLAGLVAGHIKNLEEQEIVNLGAACGAANCLRKDLGMLYKEDVLNLLADAS